MPRAGLTPSRVVAEAARLADRDGYEAVSLTALATSLGVRAPSLYKHVAGLPAVRDALALAGLAELDARLAGAAAASGPGAPARLAGMSGAYRAFARERPGLYAAALRAPGADAPPELETVAAALTEHVLALVEAHGVHGQDAVHAARALRSALHGFVALEAAGGFGLPEDVEESFTRLVEDAGVALRARGS